MMYCSWNPGTVVDGTGKPIPGAKVSVHVHDSYAPAQVYTFEGDEYIPAPNPQFLGDDARLGATLFMELGVYDIEIQRPNGDGTFSVFDIVETGIDARLDDIGRVEVDSVEDLEALDPSVSGHAVTVSSYPRRTYVWDAESTDTPDGGIVVDSSVEGAGNWILAWDCPYLPSSVYGVTGGDATNIPALFGYARVVGSAGIPTPSCVVLEPGTYSMGNAFCTRKLAFMKGARFTGTVTVPDVEVLGQYASWIGDILFSAPGKTAHSSWYRTAEAFWKSGADILCVDSTNYFADTRLTSSVSLAGKTVTGTGTGIAQYTNGTYFMVDRTAGVPDGFFRPASDYVRVESNIGDAMFTVSGAWDPGLISDGHHVEYVVVPSLSRFGNTDRWFATMLERRARMSSTAWNVFDIDLEGREVTGSFTLPAGGFSQVLNARLSGTTRVAGTCRFDGCSVRVLPYGTDVYVTAANSTVDILPGGSVLKSLTLFDSYTTVAAPGIDPADTRVAATGGRFSGNVRLSGAHAGAYSLGKSVIFDGVQFDGTPEWRVNTVTLRGCTGAMKLDLLPASGGDGYFYWNCDLEGNTFTGAGRVWFGYYGTSSDPHAEIDGKLRMNGIRVVGNRFDGTDPLGIKMAKYNARTVNALLAPDVGTWEYLGNSGACPRMVPGAMPGNADWTATGSHYVWVVNPNWTWNIWCPWYNRGDAVYSEAREPSGKAVLVKDAAPCQWHTVNGQAATEYAYAYGGMGVPANLSELDDENVNDVFVVKVGVGTGTIGGLPPSMATGTVRFPLAD